jgi:hypothetical protein
MAEDTLPVLMVVADQQDFYYENGGAKVVHGSGRIDRRRAE